MFKFKKKYTSEDLSKAMDNKDEDKMRVILQEFGTDESTIKSVIADALAVRKNTSKYGGMTVNERLSVAGVIDEFDAAALAKDENKMREILQPLELGESNIKAIIDSQVKVNDIVVDDPVHFVLPKQSEASKLYIKTKKAIAAAYTAVIIIILFYFVKSLWF